MAFCKACGQDAGDASFCPKCGAAQGASLGGAQSAAVAAPGATAADYPTAGMEENIAGFLCYLVGWITGLIFLLIDKRPFVRFHGAQSIAFNISIFPIWIALWIVWLIIAHIPIFTLQRQEGRIFAPMAYTIVSALLGSLLFSLTLVPVLAYFLLGRGVPHGENRLVIWCKRLY